MKHKVLPQWLQDDLKDATKSVSFTQRERFYNEAILTAIRQHPQLFREGYRPMALSLTSD